MGVTQFQRCDYSKLSEELSSAESIAEVGQIIGTAARKCAGSQGATFVLRDGDKCFYAAEDAISPLWKGLKFPLEACVSGLCMTSKLPILIPDIYKDPRVPIQLYSQTFVKSLLLVPVRTKDPLAAIGIYWSEVHHPSEAEIEEISVIANCSSVALQNLDLKLKLEGKISELEAAAQAKDDFLLMLSHELRTPMNSILGWSSYLSESDEIKEEEWLTGLESINRNAKVQMRLIADLLEASQIIAGRLRLDTASIDLTQVILAAAKSYSRPYQSKSVALDLSLPPHPLLLQGDFERLLQVVGNLLANALKYSERGGTVKIAIEDEGPNFAVSIQDHGQGIHPEMISKIFDRFQDHCSQSNRSVGGVGLGLSVVKSIVESHGGNVIVSSPGLGLGARFELRLPAESAIRVPTLQRREPVFGS